MLPVCCALVRRHLAAHRSDITLNNTAITLNTAITHHTSADTTSCSLQWADTAVPMPTSADKCPELHKLPTNYIEYQTKCLQSSHSLDVFQITASSCTTTPILIRNYINNPSFLQQSDTLRTNSCHQYSTMTTETCPLLNEVSFFVQHDVNLNIF